MTIMMVAFVGITAVACSKEDKSQNANAEIIGKWRREYKETIKYIKNGGAAVQRAIPKDRQMVLSSNLTARH